MSQDHPCHKSVRGFVAALEILAKYMPKGMDEKYFIDAQHDVISSNVGAEAIAEDSDDGRTLKMLGWHLDDDCESWAYFT